jgi:hypothetical protein
MTEEGRLIYGIEWGGKLHFDFALRLPTVADNIAAIEEVGTESNLRLSAAMLALSLVKLGDVPQDQISLPLLLTAVDEDYDVLAAAQDRLKKKRRASSEPSATSAQPASSSASTESAPSAA